MAKMDLVDSLIEVEGDHFGALQVLHPNLYEHVISYVKRLQRKIDTYELKTKVKDKKHEVKEVTESTDQRVINLERVVKEMKK